MLALESMISIKFMRGLHPKPWPKLVLVAWGTAAVVFASLLVVWQVKRLRARAHKAAGVQAAHLQKAAVATNKQQHVD